MRHPVSYQIFHSPLIVLCTFVVKTVDCLLPAFFFSQQRNLSIEGWFERNGTQFICNGFQR